MEHGVTTLEILGKMFTRHKSAEPLCFIGNESPLMQRMDAVITQCSMCVTDQYQRTAMVPWDLRCWFCILPFLAPLFLITSSGPGEPLLSSTSSTAELRSPPGLDCHQGRSVGRRMSERELHPTLLFWLLVLSELLGGLSH